MSLKRDFHAAICEIAHSGHPEALPTLLRMRDEFRKALALATAQELMIEGWKRAGEGPEHGPDSV